MLRELFQEATMSAKIVSALALLVLPAAANAQLAGHKLSMHQFLSARQPPAGLAVKPAAQPGAPWAFPTTGAQAIAFSPDGRWIATSDNLQSVYLWDRQTGQAKWVFEGHFRHITRLEFTADSVHLLASHQGDALHGFGQELSVWKVAKGE